MNSVTLITRHTTVPGSLLMFTCLVKKLIHKLYLLSPCVLMCSLALNYPSMPCCLTKLQCLSCKWAQKSEHLLHYHLGRITGSIRVQTIKCLITQLWSCSTIKQNNPTGEARAAFPHFTPASLFVISHNKVVNWREIYLTTLDVCQISIGH